MPIAHVKWFIESPVDVPAFSFTEPSVIVWFIIVLLGATLAYFIEKKWATEWRRTSAFLNKLPKLRKKVSLSKALIYFLQFALGVSLLFASWNGALIAPHYTLENPEHILLYFQAGIGIMMLLNLLIPYAAGLLIALYIIVGALYGPLEILDYINVIGIALFLIFINHKDKAKKVMALPALRILTGAALIILAFSEKLFAPQKALSLLENYDLNFMTMLGIDYSDRLFILSAGSMEALFGIILIGGWITRINVISLACFLIASNLYFLIAGYPEEALVEIMGHIPVIASALLFIVWGSGIQKKAKQQQT